MGKCPEPATCHLSANASPCLHLPQVFFSYAISLGCHDQIKDFPTVFLNVPPYKLHLFQQNKIFSYIKAELLFRGHFPTSFLPQHLFLLFFISIQIQSRDMGKREGSATDCPVATSKGER